MQAIDTVLTHEEFFTHCLNPNFPGLEGIDCMARQGDFAAAEEAFAAMLKATLDPIAFLTKETETSFQLGSIAQTNETPQAIAQRIMHNQFISVQIPYTFENGIDYELNPTPNGYREWTWQLNRHHEWIYLALAYRQTKEEKYALKFRELILEYIRQVPEPGNVTGGATNGWRTIEVGIRCSNSWPVAIHSFLHSPSISDHDWTVIFKSVYENANRLLHHSTTGNWLIMEMDGLTHCGLLFPFFREANTWKEFAMQQLLDQIACQIYDDGFQYELTTNYHQVVIFNYLMVVKLYKRLGQPVPDALMNVLETLYSLYPKLATPELTTPDLNDGNRQDLTDIMQDAADLFPGRSDFLYLASSRKQGEPPAFTNIQLPNSGMAIFRSGWQKNDIWCFFEDAPFGFGHQHEDKLNILLYAYGKEMITEAGCNSYDGSKRHVYALSTQGHNAILVDGHSQCRRPHYRRDSIRLHENAGMGYQDTPAFAAAQGIFDETFGEAAQDIRHHRRLLYLKKPDYSEPFFIVIDRLYGDGSEHTYDCLWHYTDHPYTVSGNTILLDCGDNITLTTLTTGYDSVQVVRGQEEPYQGWMASWNGVDKLPIPTAILTKQSAADVRLITVLVPNRQCQCPFIKVTASDNPQNTTLTLHTQNQQITINETDFFPIDFS